MGSATILTLRALLALSLIGSLWVQLLVLPALWGDLATVPIGLRVTVIMILALWLVCLQVVALCIWRLVSMAAADAVFSARAFRFVDAVIGAIAVAAILTGVLATLMAPGPAAPGVVGIVYGAALATGGVALVVVVMRSLLRKAIEMRSELDEVV